MITPLGFIDTSTFTSMFVVKYKERMKDGLLWLRGSPDTVVEIDDASIMKEWKSARALLQRIKNKVAETTKAPAELGRAWIETLEPHSGTPWSMDPDEHTASFVRFRICLLGAPGCWSFSGNQNAQLAVGVVNLIENRVICSEANFSDYPRTHLIVEVSRPDAGV